MKNIAISVFFLLFVAGCASKSYVREQVDPIADRMSALESRAEAKAKRFENIAKRAETAADHGSV